MYKPAEQWVGLSECCHTRFQHPKERCCICRISRCPEPFRATYKLKFTRCIYTKEGSHTETTELFYATFLTTAENAAKSHHTHTHTYQSYRLVLDIIAHKSNRSNKSDYYFCTAQLLKSKTLVRANGGGEYKKADHEAYAFLFWSLLLPHWL